MAGYSTVVLNSLKLKGHGTHSEVNFKLRLIHESKNSNNLLLSLCIIKR